jgi:predicted nucleic acid-binding protein
MLVAMDIRKTSIRSTPKIAIPDAIIMGTAVVRDATIITRNTKDFRNRSDCRIRTPYGVTSTNPVGFINILPPKESDLP